VSKVKEFVEEQLEVIAQTKGYKILEARVMPDHIYLVIQADPFDSPTNILTKGYKILEARVMPDHIHLVIQADPFDSPTNILKIFKVVTGLRMSRKFPDIESKLWRGVMWSPSYYVGTAGHVSAEMIEYQRTADRGGKCGSSTG
jgi:REP element-mobilizing transposase RayT